MAARRRLCSMAVSVGSLCGSPATRARPWCGRYTSTSCAFVDCFQRTARGSLADTSLYVVAAFWQLARPVLMVFSRGAKIAR